MPADDRLGLDEDEGPAPFGPEPPTGADQLAEARLVLALIVGGQPADDGEPGSRPGGTCS